MVYKALSRKSWGRGYTWSGPYHNTIAYIEGKTIKARAGKLKRLQPSHNGRAFEGIYVFNTEVAARHYMGVGAIATCQVNPKDWLCSSASGTASRSCGARSRGSRLV